MCTRRDSDESIKLLLRLLYIETFNPRYHTISNSDESIKLLRLLYTDTWNPRYHNKCEPIDDAPKNKFFKLLFDLIFIDTYNPRHHNDPCCNGKLIKQKFNKLFETNEKCQSIHEKCWEKIHKLRNCESSLDKIKKNVLNNPLQYKIVGKLKPIQFENNCWKDNGDIFDDLPYLIRLLWKQEDVFNIDKEQTKNDKFKFKLIPHNQRSNDFNKYIIRNNIASVMKKPSIRIFHNGKIYVLDEFCFDAQRFWMSIVGLGHYKGKEFEAHVFVVSDYKGKEFDDDKNIDLI